jgi:hypothetical protein
MNFTRFARAFVFAVSALAGCFVTTLSAQVSYSVNNVAYVDATLHQGSNFITNPLNAGDNRVGNVFRGVPDGAVFLKWNPAAGAFDPTNRYSARSGWSNPDMTVEMPYGGILITPVTVKKSFVGEPWPVNCLTFKFPYTFAGFLPQLSCSLCINGDCPAYIPDDTTMYRWDPVQQQPQEYTYYSFDGWTVLGVPVNPQFRPAEAAMFMEWEQFTAKTPGIGGTLSQRIDAPMQAWQRSESAVQVRLPLATNSVYSVLCSSNLAADSWQTVQQGIVSPSNSLATISLPRGTNGSAYYRVAAWPISTNVVLFNPVRRGTNFQCQLFASVSSTYILERTATLTNGAPWVSVGVATSAASNIVTLVDSNATSASAYYRARY